MSDPNGWELIGSAPKDGARVLLWAKEWSAPHTGQFYGDAVGWGSFYDAGAFKHQPTHWQLLPEAPTENSEAATLGKFPEWVKVGASFRWGGGGPIHVRGFVDDRCIVREWIPSRHQWIYKDVGWVFFTSVTDHSQPDPDYWERRQALKERREVE